MNFTTISSNFNLAEAELVRSRLAAAGFHPFIANEMAAGWLGNNSSSTLLRVEVPEGEAVEAKEFLATPPQEDQP
jgi:hypothetical protein